MRKTPMLGRIGSYSDKRKALRCPRCGQEIMKHEIDDFFLSHELRYDGLLFHPDVVQSLGSRFV